MKLVILDGYAENPGDLSWDGLKTLVYSKPETDSELAKNTAARLTKGQIIELIEITNQARIKIKQNISIHLLTTWLCGEYRRISWQR